ncbi:MAG: hypothetical protein KA781_06515 [Aquabacterium sp.]|nr:hypothetical protein [Aquabacterium sp.]
MTAVALGFSGQACAQSSSTNLVVVVNAKMPAPALTAKDVTDLYLGRTRNLSNGQAVVPLDNPAASATRARFYKALTGKAITDINAYWARLLFTGQSSPPQPMADTAALLDAVRSSPFMMAYVEQSQIPNPEALGLKIVLSIPAP